MKKKQANVIFRSDWGRKKPILLSGLVIMLTVLMTFSAAASASLTPQQKKITGKVTDVTTGEALPGVTIVIRGTTTGVASDLDGSYSIDVPSSNTVLQFTSVGYASPGGDRRITDSHQCGNAE